MVRPLSATDDQILEAAKRVLWRRGHDGFSVSEVAQEVGLSRSAINLRFDGSPGLQRALYQRLEREFEQRMEGCPAEPGPNGLIEIAAFIGRMAGDRNNLSHSMANFHNDTAYPERLAFERRRGEILSDAIGRAMPITRIEHESAVLAFRAHLVGSLIAWQGSEHPDGVTFMVERTKQWLQLTGITDTVPAGSAG